ncbi:MAG TPA: DUF4386 domain-containing protein [Cyclobacteriaceae bacterium]|nr:DUF4386 domain-containing protein [Cyclobacteriaceae bacterium]
MTPLRKTSIVAGVIYLVTFASVPTLSLYSSLREPNSLINGGADTGVIIGCVLELIVGLAGIGTAVVLFPVLKKQNEAMAIGLVGSRILEASTIFGGVAFMLATITLRQSHHADEAVMTAFVTMYDKLFLVGQSLMPVIDDLLLGLLLYHSRLVPRTLSVIGIVGAPVLLGADLAVVFGIIGQRDPIAMLPAIPVALFEFGLGTWLIVKGFNEPVYSNSGH